MDATTRFQHFQVYNDPDGRPLELGRGGMGITYKAFDVNLRCDVALKVINPMLVESESARQRFFREARAAAALRHPHVATVYHLGEEGGTVFYAMEFIEGETLEALIAREGRLDERFALGILDQVADALGAAMRLGLVHRDIKPSNLMLRREFDGRLCVKLIDFGLAKGDPRPEITTSATLTAGGFVGTPHYASPEQLEEFPLDARSDIYSLGITFYYMLCGKPPFSGSTASVISQHLTREIPLDALGDRSPTVIHLIQHMAAKRPDDRPSDALELRARIAKCREALEMGTTGQEAQHSAVKPVLPGDRLSEHARPSSEHTPAGQPSDAPMPAAHQPASICEKSDGVSLLAVLKARKSLPADESLAVMRPLAEALDAAMHDGVPCPELSLLDVLLTPAAPPSTPLDEWPGLAVHLDTSAFLDRHAEDSSRTIVPSVNRKRSDAEDLRTGYLALAASFTYELLGGPHTNASAEAFTPLPSLSEEGNTLLTRALAGDPAFASIGDFVCALERSEGGRRKPSTHASAKSLPQPVPPPAQFASEELPRRASPLRSPVLLLAACAGIVALAAAVHIFRNPPTMEAIPPTAQPDKQISSQAISTLPSPDASVAPKQESQETVDSNLPSQPTVKNSTIPLTAAPGQPDEEAKTGLSEHNFVDPKKILAIADTRLCDGTPGTKTLRVAIKARPNTSVDNRQMKLHIFFYEQDETGKIQPTSSPVVPLWISPPVNWADNEPELLDITYILPDSNLPGSAASKGSPGKKFVGYIVGVYYNGELQDTHAEPVTLAKQFPLPLAPENEVAGSNTKKSDKSKSEANSKTAQTKQPRYIAVNTEGRPGHKGPSVMVFDTQTGQIVGNKVYELKSPLKAGQKVRFDGIEAVYMGDGSVKK